MTTKEKILFETLNLCSAKGYNEVSMRDIGAAVGIRESSIYKHYANKKAILNAIVVLATNQMNQMLLELNVPDSTQEDSLARYVNMEFEDIAALCTNMLLKQMENEIVSKFRRLLTMEQYRNEELRKIYVELFMERQLQYNEQVFQYLLDIEVLKGSAAKQMAMEFYAPFFLMQYQYLHDADHLKQVLMEHVKRFLEEHVKEE